MNAGIMPGAFSAPNTKTLTTTIPTPSAAASKYAEVFVLRTWDIWVAPKITRGGTMVRFATMLEVSRIVHTIQKLRASPVKIVLPASRKDVTKVARPTPKARKMTTPLTLSNREVFFAKKWMQPAPRSASLTLPTNQPNAESIGIPNYSLIKRWAGSTAN